MKKTRVLWGAASAVLASSVVVACLSSTPPPAGSDDAGLCSMGSGSVTSISQVDGGLCGACVQSQCGSVINTCATDCTCNDNAVQAISCLETLGTIPSATQVTSCLTALGNATDGPSNQLATCLQGCESPCGVDGGDASLPGDAATDSTLADAAETGPVGDTGLDAPSDTGGDTGIDAPADTGVDAPAEGSSSCVTSISGTVYDPAGKTPLYGVTVAIASGAISSIPRGVATGAGACSCAALQTPSIVSTTSTIDGTFSLDGAPAGAVEVVVQVGKWRHVESATLIACQNNALGKLQLPSAISAGTPNDAMPDVAVSTGSADALECLLSRVGVADTEWVPGNSTGGHVHVFAGGGPTDGGLAGEPEKNVLSGAPASSSSLWDTTADLLPYDLLLLSCEGGETFDANPTALEDYLDQGGRVLASHYHYSWFAGALQSGQGYDAPTDWNNLATWTSGPGLGDGGATTANAIPQTALLSDGGTFAKGVAAKAWLGNVGALTPTEVAINEPRYNATVSPTNTPSQPWLVADNASGDPGAAMLFTFDTPMNPSAPSDGGAPTYCGRVAYTDLHDDDPSDTTNSSAGGQAAPLGCAATTLSAQEKELEFLLFDLSGCVVPDSAGP